jgi:hypothetical protein
MGHLATVYAVLFQKAKGHNLEVYVDNIIVKSRQSNNLIADLEEALKDLRRFNIKLNPERCTFEVSQGKLLG